MKHILLSSNLLTLMESIQALCYLDRFSEP